MEREARFIKSRGDHRKMIEKENLRSRESDMNSKGVRTLKRKRSREIPGSVGCEGSLGCGC